MYEESWPCFSKMNEKRGAGVDLRIDPRPPFYARGFFAAFGGNVFSLLKIWRKVAN